MEQSTLTEMYPSPAELFGEMNWIGKQLLEELHDRYAIHGPEYLTDKKHADGRPVNACMDANSATDAIEEVVDAIFNVLVLRFKGYAYTTALRQLLSAYTSLRAMQDFISKEAAGASV